MSRLYWTAESASEDGAAVRCIGDGRTHSQRRPDDHHCGLLVHSLCAKSGQEDMAKFNKDKTKPRGTLKDAEIIGE
jgi:hypothetical protein